MLVLFLKANPYRDRWGQFARAPEGKATGSQSAEATMPSSAGIKDKREAREYWEANLGGKTINLSVKHPKGKGVATVSFAFPIGNTHAWTKETPEGETPDLYDRGQPRSFERERAACMEFTLQSLAAPWRCLLDRDKSHLYLGAKIDRDTAYYLVFRVLQPGHCEFITAQPRAMDVHRHRARILRPVNPGNLPDSAFSKAMTPPLASEDGAMMSDFLADLSAVPPRHRGPAAVASQEEERSAVAGEFVARFMAFFKALGPGERWITVAGM